MMSFTSAISLSVCFDLLFLELKSIGNNPCTPKVGKVWYNLPSLDPILWDYTGCIVVVLFARFPLSNIDKCMPSNTKFIVHTLQLTDYCAP